MFDELVMITSNRGWLFFLSGKLGRARPTARWRSQFAGWRKSGGTLTHARQIC
jgi:hypothetical protein